MKTIELLVVLSTFPDATAAASAGETLVRESLAACVSLVPGILSIYHWEGSLEKSQEVLAIIKTTTERYPALERRLQELHPGQVPEILALPTAAASAAYHDWAMRHCTAPQASP